ncbi:hypothetical protein FAF44_02560 [Nonomuraea sp. MG754425]|uniref:hypothetical protein n=1 Tax=Nonomuraea sp. MG754425 TaxID=2570319 RepID=UPI001F45EEA7|nr:hypothetical protein [Nonomuraea sp. MG754425]MCF6467295.1 hypothetical protein [Nonomuraea sp. MG754425]
MPRGMRRAGSQKEWLRTLKEDLETLELRCDGYANLTRIANLIAWAANWSTMCSRPTIARLVEVTGLSQATVKRWVRWLRVRGWLGTVEEGSTCQFRKGTAAGLLDDGLGNRAAVWVLAVPRRSRADRLRDHDPRCVDLPERTSEPPTGSLPERTRVDPTRTREERSPSRPREPRISPHWPLHATARTKRDKIALCERLRAEAPILRRVTAWYLRWWLSAFIDEGWTAADVLHALDSRADDSRWTYTWSSVSEIRHVPGWVRHRLAAWLDGEGRPVASRSQRRAAVDAARRAGQEARRREWAAMRAAAGWVEAPAPDAVTEDCPVVAAVLGVTEVPEQPAVGPNAAFVAARAEMERRRREKEAAELEALAAWRARRLS